jgi:hypothetical protein
MKRLWSFGLTSILTLTLTLAPVQAQTAASVKSGDTSTTTTDSSVNTAPSGKTMDGKTADDGTQVLSAVPPSDTSNPPGRTSKAVVVAVIIGGAALIAGLILLFHGDKTPGTVLVPGTPTVGAPGR